MKINFDEIKKKRESMQKRKDSNNLNQNINNKPKENEITKKGTKEETLNFQQRINLFNQKKSKSNSMNIPNKQKQTIGINNEDKKDVPKNNNNEIKNIKYISSNIKEKTEQIIKEKINNKNSDKEQLILPDINNNKNNVEKEVTKSNLSNIDNNDSKDETENNNNQRIESSKKLIESNNDSLSSNNKNFIQLQENSKATKTTINDGTNKNLIKKVQSFHQYNCHQKILQKLFQENTKDMVKRNNSFLKKNCKINIDNYIPKKPIKKQNDEEEDDLNDIIKIDELEKETKPTTLSEKEKSQNKPNNTKKKFSLFDENNCLAIKLATTKQYTKDDFEVETFLGKGAYGTVLKVALKSNQEQKFAIKKLDINSLYSVNRLYQAYLENDILRELDSPYIIKTYGAFESGGKIHIVMDYLPKGDFEYFIKANYPLKEDIIRFYSAEIILFLEYMQSKKLVHRDLKPQNIMIDQKGHLKVIDFGTVRKLGYYFDRKEMKFKEEKIFRSIDSDDIKGIKNIVNPDNEDADVDEYDDYENEDEEDETEEEEGNDNILSEKKHKKIQKIRVKRAMTFVGTAEYISPEVIGDRPAEVGTDIWAFGVMLYQMYFNSTPFKAMTAYLTFRKIENPHVTFPKNVKISEQAKDLITKILVVDPKKRLGGGEPGTPYDIAHLKQHPFFKKFKWNDLHNTSPPGIKQLKFYECRKKSIYKKNNNVDITDGYAVFNDNSKIKANNIRTLKEGIIKKKSMWFQYNKRRIILDSTPRIILTKLEKDDKYKKEILLNKKCKLKIVENNCFDLQTPVKTYRFKGNNKDGNQWASDISYAIRDYGKD